MLESNDQIRQACLLDATPVSSWFLPVSAPDSSSVEPFSFGYSSNQAGTTVLSAKHTHDLLILHDQPTCDQHIFSLVDH
jgi:hypothetical protein